MKITGLHIDGFGKLENFDLSFEDGINIVCGGNESGKSTLAAFIFCMLFGTEKGSEKGFLGDASPDGMNPGSVPAHQGSRYERYLPWSGKEAYGGSLELVHEGGRYRISRDFLKKEGGTVLTDLNTGREIECGEQPLSIFLPGPAAAEYMNTFFAIDGNGKASSRLSDSLKKIAGEDGKSAGSFADTDYALKLLEKRKQDFNGAGTEEKIKKLNELIENEEKEEKRLDELAGDVIAGAKAQEELDQEIESLSKPSLFEEKEQEYYAHKERYKNYLKDLAESRKASEQLEKTIRLRTELEERSKMLPECRDELRNFRSFIRENDEESRRAKQDIDRMNTQLLTTGKDNMFRQGALIFLTAVSVLLAVILFIAKKNSWLVLLCFLLGLVFAGIFFGLGIGVKRKRDSEMQVLAEKKEILEELKVKRKEFVDNHPSEAELEARYEKRLKEDGRIPEIAAKEKELGDKIKLLDEELESSRMELLDFFGAFGKIESLKDDVLKLQEDELVRKREERLAALSELREKAGVLAESNMKLRMQIETGEENGSRLLSHRNEKKKLQGELERNRREINAIDLAIKTIKELAGAANESLDRMLEEKAGKYAAAFTKNRHRDLHASDNTAPGFSAERYVPAEYFSRGANAQMELAMRIAAGDLLFAGRELPLIFDDAFVFYDDERLAMTMLELSGHPGQKIIFTCRSREETLLSELGLAGKIIRL